MSDAPPRRIPAGGPRSWLFAICAACTAWLILQNSLLLALAWIVTRVKP